MITRLSTEDFDRAVPALAELLVDAVAGGASVGFVQPFGTVDATAWWRDQAPAVAGGRLWLWLAYNDDRVVGTISLALASKTNARHRAEIIKLMVHRDAQGRGLGRHLLATAEDAAREAGLSLLLLDTETDSAADRLYDSAGWTRYGIVPRYAGRPDGQLSDCTFYFKTLHRTV